MTCSETKQFSGRGSAQKAGFRQHTAPQVRRMSCLGRQPSRIWIHKTGGTTRQQETDRQSWGEPAPTCSHPLPCLRYVATFRGNQKWIPKLSEPIWNHGSCRFLPVNPMKIPTRVSLGIAAAGNITASGAKLRVSPGDGQLMIGERHGYLAWSFMKSHRVPPDVKSVKFPKIGSYPQLLDRKGVSTRLLQQVAERGMQALEKGWTWPMYQWFAKFGS